MRKMALYGVIVVLWPATLSGQFTRQEYLDAYTRITKIEIRTIKIASGLLLAPELKIFDPPTLKKLTRVVQIPTVGFTFVKTVEYKTHRLFRRAPDRFIRRYGPLMNLEKQTQKRKKS